MFCVTVQAVTVYLRTMAAATLTQGHLLEFCKLRDICVVSLLMPAHMNSIIPEHYAKLYGSSTHLNLVFEQCILFAIPLNLKLYQAH